MKTPSEDDFSDEYRQDFLDKFRLQIEDIMINGVHEDVINGTIQDVSAEEIGQYLNQIVSEQDTSLKDTRLTKVQVSDLNLLINLCDYMSISLPTIPTNLNIFFLESGDFATTIIPVDLETNTTNMFIQPLEDSSEEIKQLWIKALEEKSKLKRKGKIDVTKIPGVRKGLK